MKIEKEGRMQMKKTAICLAWIMAFSYCFVKAVRADEISDLKDQIKVMQKQMQKMQQEIDKFKAEKKTQPNRPAELEERVTAFEEKSEIAHPAGLASLKGTKFELGGELELEFVATEWDTRTDKPNRHFQIDTFYLYPNVTFTDYDALLHGDIAFKTDKAFIEELWVRFSGLPANFMTLI
jgi:hypothetical protein